VIDSRIRSRRSGAILAAALFIIASVPGMATAANSRTLFIGSDLSAKDDQGVPLQSGQLFPTTVTVPGDAPAPKNSTVFLVEILSTDNQNLAHTVLTVEANHLNATGLSLNTFYDPDAGGHDADQPVPCSSSGNTITCDYGSLAARGERTIAVVVDVARTYVAPVPAQPLFWAKVETNNETGPNQQLFVAASGPSSDDPTPPTPFNVGAHSEDGLNTFVPPGLAKQLFTSGLDLSGTDNLSTFISFTAHGAGDRVAITEGTSDSSHYPCPTDLVPRCQGGYSEVKTSTETFGSTPYFTWMLTAKVPKTYTLSQGFVVHFDTLTHSDWRLLFKDKSSFCGTLVITSIGHCIKSLSLSKPVGGFSTLIVEVVMDHQGGMKA